ncbi:histidine kinase [Actinoplanes sp. NPDC051851]|uniref:sensor histidine kinase n=1 Tax=Actinoplanes sp. NPDC051851 TaxID=3154753 RepID=UPI00342E2B16
MEGFTGFRIAVALCGLGIAGVAAESALFAPGHTGVNLSLCVIVVQAVALLALLVRPGAALIVWLICLCGPTLLGVFDQWAGGTAAMCQLALLNLVYARGGRLALVAWLVTFVDVFGIALLYEPADRFAPIGATMVLWTTAAAGLGAAVRVRHLRIAAIEDRARWAMETREVEARRRVAEEQLRIARDLHDVLGHHVAVVRLHTGLARRVLHTDPGRAEEALREAETASETVLREMAGMLRILREPGSEGAGGPVPGSEGAGAPAPGLADLDPLVATLVSGGMRVAVERSGDPGRVPDVVGVTAYRVVQELLTNARRHGTGETRLSLDVRERHLVIRVSNPVPAVTGEAEPGYGLLGMRERVRAVGGRLTVAPRGTDFEVVAELPLNAYDEEAAP